MMKHPTHSSHSKRHAARPAARMKLKGFMLLEVLCALLIFSIGILGIVGLQANATKQSSAAEYRSMAAMLASDLVSKMWLSNRTTTTLQAYYGGTSGSGGAGYNTWRTTVTGSGLPNAATYSPTVTFATVAGGGSSGTSSSLATITICWTAPGDTPPTDTTCTPTTASNVHKYVVIAQVK